MGDCKPIPSSEQCLLGPAGPPAHRVWQAPSADGLSGMHSSSQERAQGPTLGPRVLAAPVEWCLGQDCTAAACRESAGVLDLGGTLKPEPLGVQLSLGWPGYYIANKLWGPEPESWDAALNSKGLELRISAFLGQEHSCGDFAAEEPSLGNTVFLAQTLLLHSMKILTLS